MQNQDTTKAAETATTSSPTRPAPRYTADAVLDTLCHQIERLRLVQYYEAQPQNVQSYLWLAIQSNIPPRRLLLLELVQYLDDAEAVRSDPKWIAQQEAFPDPTEEFPRCHKTTREEYYALLPLAQAIRALDAKDGGQGE